MKILEAFADGTLCTDPAVCKGNPAYRKALRTMCETAKALDGLWTDEGKKLFEQFSDAQSDEGRLYAVDHFVRGYRIGALMMIEVFTGTSDLFLDTKA
ncbi:MAG: DUF6809 family protein [Oscillospiraceae bacterium]